MMSMKYLQNNNKITTNEKLNMNTRAWHILFSLNYSVWNDYVNT